MNLGHAVTDVQRLWALAVPLCQTHEAHRPGRVAAAGRDKIHHQERQQPGFGGTWNTWAIQGHREDADAAVVL